MAKIGSLFVTLAANITPFKKNMTLAGKITKGVTRAFGQMAAVLGAAVGARALYSGLRTTMDYIDAQSKFAASTGQSMEALLGLDHAANLAGVQTEALRTSMAKMTKNVSMAALGLGEARGALDGLGLDAATLNRLAPDQMLARIADALANVGNEADRVRIAMQLFGRSGASMLPLLSGGSAGIRSGMADAQALGISINSGDGRSVEAANDAFTRLGTALKATYFQLAVEISPALKYIADGLTDVVASMKGMRGAGEILTSSFFAIASVVEFLWKLLSGITHGIAERILGSLNLVMPMRGATAQAEDMARTRSIDAFRRAADVLTGKGGAGRDFAQRPMEGTQQPRIGLRSEDDLRRSAAQAALDGDKDSAKRLWDAAEYLRQAAEAQEEAAKKAGDAPSVAMRAVAREFSSFLSPGAQKKVDDVEDRKARNAIEYQTQQMWEIARQQSAALRGQTASFGV